ncbi:inner membrane CreD family protein [uncultured Muribaculum sp.]|uniref:inner membrane CreD family protein n=1 Tax=uncultured Muribaculum sp. TaxID=1918613 RepID=UPI002731952D|nr:inner membrane CreD family protein [uncultured Muribaculum sp.]
MEETNEIYKEPKYTMRWLGLQTLFVLGISIVLALIASGLDGFALGRHESGLLPENRYEYVSQSITYCFAVIAITSMSLMLIEVAFHKGINYLQYGLIGCTLCLFNLLLLAMAEKMSFWIAYVVVSIMTIALISCFVMGLTKNLKAAILSTIILVVEYGLILVLIYMGSMALLIGSLSLFLLIAVAMYFTLKLKVENEELVLK